MTEEASQPESRRVSAAHSKLKCSGTQPCDRCQRRRRECIYDARDGRNPDEERFGSTPKRARLNDTTPHRRSQDQVRPFLGEVTSRRTGLTPLTPSHTSDDHAASPHFLKNKPNKRKRWLYLGASSTWSYNIRVATLIRSALKDDPTNTSEGFTLDGDAYTLSLGRVGSDTRLDLSRLPSLDYAIYLVNTVKFHLGGILRLFDEEEFLRNLHEFYSKGPEKAGTHRLWYTQCLLLLALGKGFLNVRHSPDNTSSVDFFLRAMAILPDTIVLHDEPVLAAEVLATIALYFYCLDMRHSAYSYIGQALRLVLVEGLHADLPVDQFGERFAERCRNVWWTVYILDRTLSSAVGAPVSVQDDHVRQPLGSPRSSSQRDATLIMHVKLCRVVSYILTELYTADGSLEHSYLSKVRSVLRRMAEIAEELEDTIDFKFKSSLETLSKGALYLRMLYNQCIILVTRPLLICLLQDILGSMSSEARTRVEIPTSIRDLLQTCVDSATKTLKMLAALNSHNLLDTFLPFDLEFACSASSVLIMVDDVLRGTKISPSAKSLIPRVLDEISAGGNKAAPLRQQELQQISNLASRLWETIDSFERTNAVPTQGDQQADQQPRSNGRLTSGLENPNSQSPGPAHTRMTADPFNSPLPSSEGNIVPLNESVNNMPPLSTTSSADFAQTFDFPQEQMLFLADHLDVDALPTLLDFGNHGLDEWL
ncbi:hypothetical protein LTR72_002790 [Exophiala xenobiotica]|nr:hypothetical protein LTR72_002790 [Exophiala xenobiotica]KAK5300549.1 hypothetical protein LTR14_000946 [Exophiala xenobiotica]KAK5331123.1 hypothetical protein LTR93_000125 [Exophiala xenobiotica]